MSLRSLRCPPWYLKDWRIEYVLKFLGKSSALTFPPSLGGKVHYFQFLPKVLGKLVTNLVKN
jgi:hypothetical protein